MECGVGYIKNWADAILVPNSKRRGHKKFEILKFELREKIDHHFKVKLNGDLHQVIKMSQSYERSSSYASHCADITLASAILPSLPPLGAGVIC